MSAIFNDDNILEGKWLALDKDSHNKEDTPMPHYRKSHICAYMWAAVIAVEVLALVLYTFR